MMSKTNAGKALKKAIVMGMSLALAVAPLAIEKTDSEAASWKLKSVKVSSPVTNGGTLVLKKKQSKKVKLAIISKKGSKSKTSSSISGVKAKSSKKKVVKVIKKKGAFYVKAVAKKGSAKITFTKKNKKATLRVKIGTPIKSFKVTKWKVEKKTEKRKEANASKRTTKKTTTKKLTKSGITLNVDPDDTDEYKVSYFCTLVTKFNPTKATNKNIKWSVKEKSGKKWVASKIASVSSFGTVKANKNKVPIGAKKVAYIFGQTKDGSNKQVKIKLTVIGKDVPEGIYEEDTRSETMIEDFESYPVGTEWKTFTAGGYNSGKMTVVQDPENKDNKCLKITYDGPEQGYDFAPVFNVKLPAGKKFSDYSAVRIDSRVIGNTSDCTYKNVYTYFDSLGGIKSTDMFATSNNNDKNDPKAMNDAKLRFGVNLSMATGVDKTYNIPYSADLVKEGFAISNKTPETKRMIELRPGKKYNNKNFPSYFEDYSKGDTEAVTPGFNETDTTAENAVGFQQNTLEFQSVPISKAWITDGGEPITTRNAFDMVIGSTFEGAKGRAAADYTMIMYMDNIRFMSGEIPCTKMTLAGADAITNDGSKISLKVNYEPLNTTQTNVKWTSSDETLATVNEKGIVTAATDPEKVGDVTITATNLDNPSIVATKTIKVKKWEPASKDYDILANAKVVPTVDGAKVSTETDQKGEIKDGVLSLQFTGTNKTVFLELPETMDVSGYEGIEITGTASTQFQMEFYPDNVDTTVDNWFKDMQKFSTGPFYVASCKTRLEGGGFYDPENITKKVGKKEYPVCSEETQFFSLEDMVAKAEGGNGGKDNARYIKFNVSTSSIGKYVGPKTEGEKAAWDNAQIDITSLKFRAKAREGAETTVCTRLSNNSGSAHDIDIISDMNVKDVDGNKLYYIDGITEVNTLEFHTVHNDLTKNARFVRAKLTGAKTAELVVGNAEGKATSLSSVTGIDKDGYVYFELPKLDQDALKDVETIGVNVDAGKVNSIQIVQGTLAWTEGVDKFLAGKEGAVTPVTEGMPIIYIVDGKEVDGKVMKEAAYGCKFVVE